MPNKRVLLTGATGFVGGHLAERLARDGFAIRELGRRPSAACQDFLFTDFQAVIDWPAALKGVDYVIHAAAFAHVPAAGLRRDQAEWVWRFNAEFPGEIAAAVAGRIERLVFLSSVKVLGESTGPGQCFDQNSLPHAMDLYARSKLEAESRIVAQADLSWTIFRPPLIYGNGARGNFQRLASWVRRGWPLPLGRVDNRRSLLAIDNFADAVALSLSNPAASGQRLLLSDGAPVSTGELINTMAEVLGASPRLLNVPPGLMKGLLGLLGRGGEWQRLADSLVVDNGHIERTLGWRPPVAFAEALRRALLKSAD